jgi:hypothetical protein
MSATVIKMSVQRMVCTGCGAEANASCNCGLNYVPKSVRAAEAVKANPEKSNRAIAAETGVSEPTVLRARQDAGASHDAPDEERVGRDGNSYPATQTRARPDAKTDAKTGAANLKNLFLMNCEKAIEVARQQYTGQVDDDTRAAARRAAQAWTKVADEMEQTS